MISYLISSVMERRNERWQTQAMSRLPVTQGFTGRSQELELIDEKLATARSGAGSVIVVSGPAGIGKTTFGSEIVARARRDGMRVAWGACWLLGGAPPLWPWRQILEDLGGDELGRLLADDIGGADVDPERFARFAAVVRALTELCRRRPTLIIIDDAQSADPGALLLCRFIARNVAALPLVLLLASRTGDAVELDSETTLIRLRPFGTAETADLLRARGVAAPDDELLELVVRLTGGHPLHLQRLLSSDDHVLTPKGAQSVTAAIGAAIDDLAEPARTTLCRAAVAGPRLAIDRAAKVAGVSAGAFEEAVRRGVQVGLAIHPSGDSRHFAYGHELIRESFAERLGPDDRMTCHARAAAELALRVSPSSRRSSDLHGRDLMGEYAYHALQAAPRSAADARIAVGACRLAADAMVRAYAYEEAVALLDNAVAVHGGLDGEPFAALLTSRAEAVLRCGRLAEARTRFDEAVTAAVSENDPVTLARAALGLGGVWVNEHRTLIEWDRVTGLQRQALSELPEDEQVLRQRLTMRLAAEEFYRGGPAAPVFDGLAAARRLGDGTALAEALSLAHHALLTAAATRQRLPLAEELIAVAAPAGEGLLALFGLCWRTVDLFHLGDRRAVSSLAELRERADALGCLSILHTADAMGVMLLFRAGRLDAAEEAAHACYQLGIEVGDPDAAAYLTAQLSTIRWCQGREAEVAPQLFGLIASSSLNPAEFALSASAAHLMARTGEHDRARSLLTALLDVGLEQLPDSSTWLVGMNEVVEAAHLLHEIDICRRAYALLAPFADLPIMPSLAVACLGSVHRPLGLAASTMGQHDDGIRHLSEAVRANRSYGNRPLTAIATADLAEAHLRRDASSAADRQLAVALLTAACEEATAIDMLILADAWSRRRDEFSDQIGVIDRHGSQWTLRLAGQRAEVADRLGMRYLVQLLTNPGRPITAFELAAGPGPTGNGSSEQVVLDERAKQEYRRRLSALDAAIAEAETDDLSFDGADADTLRSERDMVIDELRHATGLSGRPRSFADAGERARTAVRKALVRTVSEISAAEPGIGEHIASCLTTGSTCCYTPDRHHPVRWRTPVAST